MPYEVRARPYSETSAACAAAVAFDDAPRVLTPTQFDDDEEEEEEEDDDDDAGRTRRGARARPSGLRFVQGDRVVDVPVPSYFEPRQLPYFVQPFALNAIRPTRVVLWANSTADGTGQAGVYEFFVPCIPICAPAPGTSSSARRLRVTPSRPASAQTT